MVSTPVLQQSWNQFQIGFNVFLFSDIQSLIVVRISYAQNHLKADEFFRILVIARKRDDLTTERLLTLPNSFLNLFQLQFNNKT